MGMYINENGYYCWKRDTQDGHGGRAEEHRREMEQIAEQIVQQKLHDIIPEIQRAATE